MNRNSIIVFFALALCFHLISLQYSKNDDDKYIIESVAVSQDSIELTTPVLSSFDPNTAKKELLVAQGLSEYTANNLIKLRSTGWRARHPEDLLKVYGMDSTTLRKIRNRIDLPFAKATKKVDKAEPSPSGTVPIHPFDPNTTSLQELLDQGFSKYAANSLIGYLKKGGRINVKEDLKRIYGVDESLYSEIESRIVIKDVVDEVIIDSKIPETLPSPRGDFDPNFAPLEELIHQGIDRKTAHSLIRYREKGFIKEKKQLRKIYGITDSLFASLESRVQINVDSLTTLEEQSKRDSGIVHIEAPDTSVYNLNIVTMEELLEVKGIGPYYSEAIVKYRTQLGGYYGVEQLLEVPAFKKEHYEILKDRFTVDGNISRISPVAEFKELIGHPYIDYELAKRFKTMSVFDMEERIEEMISTGQIEERLVPYIQKY